MFLRSFGNNTKNEKESFLKCQKFVWDTYRIILDIMKTNDKLIKNYAKVLENTITFCRENKRKNEFKRLCDSVRGYLITLIKTEKVQINFSNKVDISKPEIILILIKMRLNLLETAIELEQWQESFKTSEDIIYLMERYEKSLNVDPSSKLTKKNKM